MTSQLIQQKNQLLNAVIYIDYENIFELLKDYGVSPGEIDFFSVIMERFKSMYELNIIECIAYGNFEKRTLQRKHQTLLQSLGVLTRHSSSNGKNCSDLMLTVDTLTCLHKNPNINVFVIVSSDRDMIPLLKAIKYENKIAYVLSTKNGFNPVVSRYADYHEYLEDLFNLSPVPRLEPEPKMPPGESGELDQEKARQVTLLLFRSNIWRNFEEKGIPVSLKGYVNIVSKKIARENAEIIKDFELAHRLGYVTIYENAEKGLCLKRGEKFPL